MLRRPAFRVIGAGLAIATGALAVLSQTACTRESAAPLRIAINPWPGYEFLYLAQEMGFFQEAGVDVRIVEVPSLTDSLRAFERNQIDGFAGTLIEVAMARSRTPRTPRAIYVTDYSAGADVILASPSIPSLAALQGKRVGVELGSLGIYMLERALNQVGLDSSHVDIVSTSPGLMESLLREGRIDAAVSYPPVSLRLQAAGCAHVVFSSLQIPREIVDVLAVDASVIATRATDLARMIEAFDRAVAFALVHPDEAHAIMAAREGVSTEEFRAVLNQGVHVLRAPDNEIFASPDSPLPNTMATIEALLAGTGQINVTADPGLVFDSRPLALVRKH